MKYEKALQLRKSRCIYALFAGQRHNSHYMRSIQLAGAENRLHGTGKEYNMNKYRELTQRQQEEANALPWKFAFSNKQFAEMMDEYGLTVEDTDKIYKLGNTGGFYLKTDSDLIRGTLDRHDRELREAIAADTTGEGFIYDMFSYELANHEYCITGDVDETLDAVGLTYDEVKADDRLWHGLRLALRHYIGKFD